MKRIITHKQAGWPWPGFEWCAYRDGDEESGKRGYGRTETDAIRALEDVEGEDDDEAA